MNKGNKIFSYDETTFFGMLKIVRLSEFKNWSFFWSFVLTSSVMFFLVTFGNISNDLITISDKLSTTLLGASAGVLAIVIAGLTITISLFRPSLMPQMLKAKILHKFLFPFWLSTVLWGISIVISILLIVFEVSQQTYLIPIIFGIELFIFLFATFYTVSLTGIIIRIALQSAQIR